MLSAVRHPQWSLIRKLSERGQCFGCWEKAQWVWSEPHHACGDRRRQTPQPRQHLWASLSTSAQPPHLDRQEAKGAMKEKWQQKEQANFNESDAYDQLCEKFRSSVALKLKGKCREYGLEMTGTKRELIERLEDHILKDARIAAYTANPTETQTTIPSATEIESMKMKDLRALCASWQIQGHSKLRKKQLQQLLVDFFATNPTHPSAAHVDKYDDYSDQELRDALAAQNLPKSGDRDELLARLRLGVVTFAELIKISEEGRDDHLAALGLDEETVHEKMRSFEKPQDFFREATKGKALREALHNPTSLLSDFLQSDLSRKPKRPYFRFWSGR